MVAGREQLPLRQTEGFAAGLVLSGARATLGFCFPSRLAPSPSMGDIPVDPPAVQSPRSKSPSLSEEERDPSEPPAGPQSPRAHPLLPEAASGIPADTGSEEQPLDHPDGETSLSWGEQQRSLATPQPEGSMEQGQEFPLLEVSGNGEIPSYHRTCLWMGLSDPTPSRDGHGLKAQHCCGGCGCAGWGGGVSGLPMPALTCLLGSAGHRTPGQQRVALQGQPGPQAPAPGTVPAPQHH